MLSNREVQEALASFTCVEWLYDGLGGSVIEWTFEHGNTNEDPSVLCWILDPDGNELSSGQGRVSSPQGLVDWLEENRKASFPLVDPATYVHLSKEAASIAAKKKLGATVASLREIVADGEARSDDERGEATSLLEAIEPYATWKRERAASLEKTDPAAALKLHREIAQEFKGDEIGESEQEIFDRLRKDKAFKQEIAAFETIQKCLMLEDDMKPCKGTKKLEIATCADCRQKNQRLLQNAAALLRAVVKKHEGSAAAARAGAILEEWKLE